ncbi:hypothetical protein PGTUg99_005106 [Puccinia graminis f. sp. tritici]|uniref:Uncharacterized protein n=1 Tax=Puccinia graminis f. sp. tritici TaxID=56615 RepID=A0A5B0QDU9_PUCGR|nr:hypothetical protein PGTUg99_005106 [Puccinia graminis f. sp. tritici]
MVKGYPSRIPAIPWRIPASGCGWPLFRKTLAGIRVSQRIPEARRVDGRLEGFPSSRRGTCTLPAGRKSFQSTRYMYLVNRKETLPASEVHVPRRPEGNPPSQQGTCTSSTGRISFQEGFLSQRGTCTSLAGRKCFQPDLLDDLFCRRLQPCIDDGLQAQIAERLGQVNSLELAFQLLWTILSTSELVRCGPDEGGEGVKVTILSQMFLSGYLVNALEKHFELTRNALIFLVYLCGKEETTGAKLGEFSGVTSQYLLSFQQSIMAQWLVRQSAKIPAELAFEVEDKLVDRLVELHVSTEAELDAHPGGAMIRDANSATSLSRSPAGPLKGGYPRIPAGGCGCGCGCGCWFP